MALNLKQEYRLPIEQEKTGKLANAVIREIYYSNASPVCLNFSSYFTTGYSFFYKKKLIFIPVGFIPHEENHKHIFDSSKESIYNLKITRASYDKQEFQERYCHCDPVYKHILDYRAQSILNDIDYDCDWFLTPYKYGKRTVYIATGPSLALPISHLTTDKVLTTKLNEGVEYIKKETERLFNLYLDSLDEHLTFQIYFSGWHCSFEQDINLSKTTIKELVNVYEGRE